MPATAFTREVDTVRTRLAFEAAVARGWSREQVCRSVGISRATYYKLMSQLDKRGRVVKEKVDV